MSDPAPRVFPPVAVDAWPSVRVLHAPPHNAIESAALGDAQIRLIREPLIALVPEFNPPTLSIGYFQSAADVPEGTPFVRRLTGGGLVDAKDGYSVCTMVPAGHPRYALSSDELAGTFAIAVAAALEECGHPVRVAWEAAEFQPGTGGPAGVCFDSFFRYDLVEGDRKVAASSFYRCPTGLMQEMGLHVPCLEPGSFGRALVRHLCPLFGLAAHESEVTTTERRLAEVLFAERYNTHAWNHSR